MLQFQVLKDLVIVNKVVRANMPAPLVLKLA